MNRGRWTIDAVELGLLPDISVEHNYYQDTSGRTQNMPLIMYVLPCESHMPAHGFYADEAPIFSLAEDRIRTVDGPCELAPGLGVMPLPGHSPKPQGVRVDTAEGTFVITGDCVDTYRNFDEQLPSGRFPDLDAYRESLVYPALTGWTPRPSHDHDVRVTGRFG